MSPLPSCSDDISNLVNGITIITSPCLFSLISTFLNFMNNFFRVFINCLTTSINFQSQIEDILEEPEVSGDMVPVGVAGSFYKLYTEKVNELDEYKKGESRNCDQFKHSEPLSSVQSSVKFSGSQITVIIVSFDTPT